MTSEISKLDPGELQKADIHKIYIKLGIFVAFIFVCILLAHFTGLRSYLKNAEQIKAVLTQSGMWAPLVFMIGSAILILVGMPRLLFCAVGGMLFGFLKGFIFSQVATLAGAYGTFLFTRWGAKEWVERFVQSKNLYFRNLKKPTFLTVFLFRQLPITGVFINMVLGLSTVKHRDFLAGSLFGFMPEAIVVTLVGSGVIKSSIWHAFAQILVAGTVLVLGGIVIVRLVSRYKISIVKGESHNV